MLDFMPCKYLWQKADAAAKSALSLSITELLNYERYVLK